MINYEELINLLEGKVYGPIYNEIKITGFSDIRYAKENEVALMFRLEEKKYIDSTRAKIIICNPFFSLSYKKSFIFSVFSYETVISKLEKIFQLKNKKKIIIPKSCNIADGVVIEDNVVLGKNCDIQANVVIKSGSVLGDGVTIDSGSVIGANPFWDYYSENREIKMFTGTKGVKIGSYSYIGANTVIERGVLSQTEIGSNCRIGSSVAIAHDVKIGSNVKMVNQSGIAGLSSIGDNSCIYAQVGIMDGIKIGNNVTIFAKSGVHTDISDDSIYSGIPAINHKDNLKNLATISRIAKNRGKKWQNEEK
jgi:UDP-3-O-[3-hydroxymyristoyl] glucosamine N-acyltransferase